MRKKQLEKILTHLLEHHPDVSDINITVGRPLQVESSGKLIPAKLPFALSQITPFQAEMLALNLLQKDQRSLATLLESGSCDCAYQVPNGTRFRVNIFSQRGKLSIVLRKLSSYIPTISEMKLPEVFYKIPQERNGLILVTGSTGSGKSTSVAAILRHINETQPVHVVTLEDPIEYEHAHHQATFNQRELGSDFDSFASGLRAALRQAPKVILVGEMRDRETVEIALTAGETGHVVYSTLHTIDAGQTINRVVGMFSRAEQEFLRARLAESLKWVVCQRLVPKVGGGRAAIFEIMSNTLRTRDLIINGETPEITFYDVISEGKPYGMRTFDQNLLQLYYQQAIAEETVRSYCSRKTVVIQGIDKFKASQGIETSDIGELSMEASERPTSRNRPFPEKRKTSRLGKNKFPFPPSKRSSSFPSSPPPPKKKSPFPDPEEELRMEDDEFN